MVNRCPLHIVYPLNRYTFTFKSTFTFTFYNFAPNCHIIHQRKILVYFLVFYRVFCVFFYVYSLLTVFENTYFMFFFQISKKHDFLRFFEMTYQKVVKSL